MERDNFYKLIQEFLKEPPVIIWGSGATIAYGMPSMSDLLNMLKERFEFFDDKCTNLEEELGKDNYNQHMPKIRKAIWHRLTSVDEKIPKDILSNPNRYKGIKRLIEKFIEPHPYLFNIITTNYDRVLENVMASNAIPFTDGFTGRLLSLYDENLFSNNKKGPFVNLVKVHGSLNWFEIDREIRYYNSRPSAKYEPKIIPPGKNKYQQSYSEPYRSLIQKSDEIIKESKSLLVVGFGFNDEHLTPRITTQINKGVPIIILAKKITQSTRGQLKIASRYLALEEYTKGKTKICFKKASSDQETLEKIDGSFWKLDEFMEAF